MSQQRIVCAANRYNGRIVILGARHWDDWMRLHAQDIRTAFGPSMIDDAKEEQGFVDNQGNFLSRTEAYKVALAADQIIRRVGGDYSNGGTLYSENLY